MEDVYYTIVESPLGKLMVGGNRTALTFIIFLDGEQAIRPKPDWVESEEPFGEAIQQLKSYFAGTLRRFHLPLEPKGTPFQQDVWRKLQEIPYGETISYGELARRIGNPKAARAVGAANGKNPLSLVIPCHRVIGSDGTLTGYAGGLPLKERLLAFERENLSRST